MAYASLRKEARSGHNAKMRRMTMDYGDADPAMKKLAPVDAQMKEEGQASVGYGADSSTAKPRGDRAARKSAPANPLATYAKGGAVANRARGGRTKAKGTHVNVIIAPQGAQPQPGAAIPPPPMPIGPGAPPPPNAGPPGPPMGAMPPVIAGAPGGMPPGLVPPRARGGKVKHPDEAQDKALIQKTLKDEGLIRSDKAARFGIEGRANGGKIVKVGLEAGSVSGEGRLEKTAARARRQAGDKNAEL